MGRLNDIKKQNNEVREQFNRIIKSMDENSEKMRKQADVLEHSREHIVEIENNFQEATKIYNKKDLSFLFIATGLLCSKWVIMSIVDPLSVDFSADLTSVKDRLDSKEMGEVDTKGKDKKTYIKTLEHVKENRKKLQDRLDSCTNEEEKKKILKSINNNEKRQNELEKIINFLTKNPEIDKAIKENAEKKRDLLKSSQASVNSRFPNVKEILTRPVAYDAMFTETDKIKLPKQLTGKNHHAYTYGHDPVMGWIFGSMNIMSRSVSYKLPLCPTFWVKDEGNKITGVSDVISMSMACIQSANEDDKRIAAAVLRHGSHMMSDKFGKTGLPIPFLSSEKAQELIELGWNSEETKKYLKKVIKVLGKDAGTIGIQFSISFLINQIIKAIHLMMYNQEQDGDIEMYEVRTRRILLTANCIASSSNIIYVVLSEQIQALDIGGALETIHRIVSDKKYISRIKQEYIANEFSKLVFDSEDELYEIGEE